MILYNLLFYLPMLMGKKIISLQERWILNWNIYCNNEQCATANKFRKYFNQGFSFILKKIILKVSVGKVSWEMEKVQQFFTDLKLRLKLKWQRRQTHFLIQLCDFFPCEFFFEFWGFPFFKSYNAQRDFSKRIFFALVQISNIFFAIIALISAHIFFNTQTQTHF